MFHRCATLPAPGFDAFSASASATRRTLCCVVLCCVVYASVQRPSWSQVRNVRMCPFHVRWVWVRLWRQTETGAALEADFCLCRFSQPASQSSRPSQLTSVPPPRRKNNSKDAADTQAWNILPQKLRQQQPCVGR